MSTEDIVVAMRRFIDGQVGGWWADELMEYAIVEIERLRALRTDDSTVHDLRVTE